MRFKKNISKFFNRFMNFMKVFWKDFVTSGEDEELIENIPIKNMPKRKRVVRRKMKRIDDEEYREGGGAKKREGRENC